MKILLGTNNPSKKQSLEMALQELQMNNYEIITYDVSSGVSSKPIGYEIIRGADNRNSELREIATKNQIDYDYLCSIEGGFSLDENGLPFVVTYCIVENKEGKKSTGKSLGIRLTKDMFDYVKKGNSLNKLIEEISEVENNKHSNGITGYLTRNLYSRQRVDKDAVVSAFVPFVFSYERELLNKFVLECIDR